MATTILENNFTNEEKKIREILNNIPILNCIKNYAVYLDVKIDENQYPLESDFCHLLYKRSEDFIRKALIHKFTNDVIEEQKYDINKLIEKHVESLIDSPYSYTNAVGNGDLEDFISDYFTDEEFYPLLIEEMRKTLESVLEKSKNNKKQNNYNELKKQLDVYEKRIKDTNKIIEQINKKIKKMEEE